MPWRPKALRTAGQDAAAARSAQEARERYERKQPRTEAQKRAKAIRSSKAWQNCVVMYLARNPECKDPYDHHKELHEDAAAAQVHHIEPLEEAPELAFRWSNLMGVCTKCHARLSQEERRGP